MAISRFQNRVEEEWGKNSITFRYLNPEDFYMTGYKILQNFKGSALLKGTRILWDGEVTMVFDVGSYTTLEAIAPTLKGADFIEISKGLISSYLAIRGNGFVQEEDICFGADNIFVSSAAMDVSFLYLPLRLETDTTSQLRSLEEKIRSLLLEMISDNPQWEDATIQRLKACLVNRSVSFEEMVSQISSWKTAPVRKRKLSSILLKEVKGSGQIPLKLVGGGVILGRDSRRAQKVIPDPNISGRHCRIGMAQDGIYIEDLGSTNGTRVNGKAISPGIKQKIADQDRITLAKRSYQVEFVYGGDYGKM